MDIERKGGNDMIRKKIRVYGRVQGVGFRYKAHHVADSLRLTGWVRNEEDGSVSMEVQGDEAMIDRMLQDLERDRYIEILDLDQRSISVDETERSFRVRY